MRSIHHHHFHKQFFFSCRFLEKLLLPQSHFLAIICLKRKKKVSSASLYLRFSFPLSASQDTVTSDPRRSSFSFPCSAAGKVISTGRDDLQRKKGKKKKISSSCSYIFQIWGLNCVRCMFSSRHPGVENFSLFHLFITKSSAACRSTRGSYTLRCCRSC